MKEILMKLTIVGTTPSTITFNSSDIVLRGQQQTVISADNAVQINEINELVNAGFVRIISEELTESEESLYHPPENLVVDAPIVEAEEGTQARIVVADENGNTSVRQGQFVNRASGEIADSPKTAASLRAMSKLKDEEDGIYVDDEPNFFEEDLPAEEQMGRKAVVSGPIDEKVDLKNSAVPGSETMKNRDPFIDRADAAMKEAASKEAFLDDDGDEGESNTAFIDDSIEI
jgi:hypothetical protein